MIGFAELDDGESVQLLSPVRGKLIEVNADILDDPSLLMDPNGAGYIVIVMRAYSGNSGKGSRICFSWRDNAGNCQHGDNCKFLHCDEEALESVGGGKGRKPMSMVDS